MGRLLRMLLTSLCLSSQMTMFVLAQDSVPPNSSVTTPNPRPIEEITVVGQQSLFRLRLRIVQKQDDIFKIFNAHNSSNKMDILCSNRTRTGTYIPSRECEPRFLKDRRAENARAMLSGGGLAFSEREIAAFAEVDYEKLQAELFALMAKNAEFAKSLAELADLTDNYQQHRKVLFPD